MLGGSAGERPSATSGRRHSSSCAHDSRASSPGCTSRAMSAAPRATSIASSGRPESSSNRRGKLRARSGRAGRGHAATGWTRSARRARERDGGPALRNRRAGIPPKPEVPRRAVLNKSNGSFGNTRVRSAKAGRSSTEANGSSPEQAGRSCERTGSAVPNAFGIASPTIQSFHAFSRSASECVYSPRERLLTQNEPPAKRGVPTMATTPQPLLHSGSSAGSSEAPSKAGSASQGSRKVPDRPPCRHHREGAPRRHPQRTCSPPTSGGRSARRSSSCSGASREDSAIFLTLQRGDDARGAPPVVPHSAHRARAHRLHHDDRREPLSRRAPHHRPRASARSTRTRATSSTASRASSASTTSASGRRRSSRPTGSSRPSSASPSSRRR